jgi:ribosome biogenesis GTPase
MKGTVTKPTGSWYTVACENGQTIPCKIKGSFRLQMSKTTNPVVVGDRVTLNLLPTEKPERLLP